MYKTFTTESARWPMRHAMRAHPGTSHDSGQRSTAPKVQRGKSANHTCPHVHTIYIYSKTDNQLCSILHTEREKSMATAARGGGGTVRWPSSVDSLHCPTTIMLAGVHNATRADARCPMERARICLAYRCPQTTSTDLLGETCSSRSFLPSASARRLWTIEAMVPAASSPQITASDANDETCTWKNSRTTAGHARDTHRQRRELGRAAHSHHQR